MKSRAKKLLDALGAIIILTLLAALVMPAVYIGPVPSPYIMVLNQARQIHMGVQCAALDYASTGAGKGAWPADSGAKTGLEYVMYLVKSGAFKESDLRLFCNPGGRRITSLKDLRSEDIIFKFGNISEGDPPETIFLMTREDIPMTKPRSWWDFFGKRQIPKDAFVVFRKGGDGMFDTRPEMRNQSDVIGIPPPREPKFLPP